MFKSPHTNISNRTNNIIDLRASPGERLFNVSKVAKFGDCDLPSRLFSRVAKIALASTQLSRSELMASAIHSPFGKSRAGASDFPRDALAMRALSQAFLTRRPSHKHSRRLGTGRELYGCQEARSCLMGEN
jgi:hypothetical protein